MSADFELPRLLDYLATFTWALSGAMIGARRGYDIVGIAAIALVSATGGGLLRDGFFLQDGPPRLVRTPTYLLIVLAAVALVSVLRRRWLGIRLQREAETVIDALGIGAYAVVGMILAREAGLDATAVVLVGVVNAVGGGVLRDILMRREPEIFRPGVYLALAAFAGCLLFLALTALTPLGEGYAAWLTIALVFALRVASVAFDLRTRAL